MTVGHYVAGWAWLLSWVAPFVLAAVLVRRRMLPEWDGALARLTEAGLAIAGLLVTGELLGIAGGFRRAPLTAAALVVVFATAWLCRVRPTPVAPADPRVVPAATTVGVVAALAAVAAAVGVWTTRTAEVLRHGISHSDSLVYQLPYAASFVQSGYTTRLHLTSPGQSPSFHPAGTELLNAMTMLAFRDDWLVPYTNVLWAAIALLAGWCIGRRAGVAAASVCAVVVMLVTPGLSLVAAGTAGSDVAAAACVLAACALLVETRLGSGELRGVVAAAVFAGLAIGTKLTALPMIVLLSLIVLWWGRRNLLSTAAAWLLPALGVGGFWYLRNVVRVGSPLPTAHLPFLPHTSAASVDKLGFTVAHYLTDAHVVWHSFRPGLHYFFGVLWPVVFVVALAGIVLAAMRGDSPYLRPLGLLAGAGVVAYAVTPTTALGPEGNPFLFTGNLRYLLPSLLLALALAPLAVGRVDRMDRVDRVEGVDRSDWVAVGFVVLVVAAMVSRGVIPGLTSRHLLAGAVAGVAALAVGIAWRVLDRERWRAVLVVAVGVVLLAVGLPLSRYYLSHRYAAPSTIAGSELYRWADTVHDARIGYVGFNDEYPLTGRDLSNEVHYVGAVGPHQSLRIATSCAEFRQEVNAAALDYLVVASLAKQPSLPPAARWVAGAAGLRSVLGTPSSRIYAVTGALDPSTCS